MAISFFHFTFTLGYFFCFFLYLLISQFFQFQTQLEFQVHDYNLTCANYLVTRIVAWNSRSFTAQEIDFIMADSQDNGLDLPPPLANLQPLKNPLGLVFQLVVLSLNLWISLLVATYRLFVPLPKKDISGQVVLITGTGRGLGQGLAMEFARHGCKIACAEIQSDLNEQTVKSVNEFAPGSCKGYFCDVGSVESVEELKRQVVADFGRVDILVNNAGLIAGGNLLSPDCSVGLVETVAKVNFLSHIWMCRTFLPEMIERNSGHIVAISSMSALTGLANGSLYTSCKWAVTGFMESVREELRRNKHNQVHTSVVCPFFINTSSEYVKNWEVRVPELSVEHCARAIVRGVRSNEVIFSIPKEQYYAAVVVKLLPTHIRDQFYDIFHAKIKDKRANEVKHFKAYKIATGEFKPTK